LVLSTTQFDMAGAHEQFYLRPATEEDLPYMRQLSEAAGQKIGPGGGDFILSSWKSWWQEQDQSMHYNQWVFAGDTPVAFCRIEVYGTPAQPESGWLEGLRVHPEFQGKGLMNKVIAPLKQRVPDSTRSDILLAVGSTNESMRPIADKKFVYLGCQVTFSGKRASSEISPEEFQLKARLAVPEDAETIWSFLTAHSAYQNSRLLMPGRFYGFHSVTRQSLDEKITLGRAFPVFEGADGNGRCIGVFFAFDTGLSIAAKGAGRGGPMYSSWYTCCLAEDLSAQQTAAVLHRWTLIVPDADDKGKQFTAFMLSVGLADNTDGKPEIEPRMQEALHAAGFKRELASHLRVYRIP